MKTYYLIRMSRLDTATGENMCRGNDSLAKPEHRKTDGYQAAV